MILQRIKKGWQGCLNEDDMKNKEQINKKLIELLLKKAEGFHYSEEQFEYEKSKNAKNEKHAIENLSFFEICDRGTQKLCDDGDKIKSANGKKIQGDEELILVKKKVTTHYIPPDMLAIKVLLEMFGKEAVSDLEKMTDEEIIKFKEKLLKDLKDEDNI